MKIGDLPAGEETAAANLVLTAADTQQAGFQILAQFAAGRPGASIV